VDLDTEGGAVSTRDVTVTYKGLGPAVSKRVFVKWGRWPRDEWPEVFPTEEAAIAAIDKVCADTKGLYKREEYSLRIEA
jgi:hypothetical protein